MKKIVFFLKKIFNRKRIREEEEQEIIRKICKRIKESDELF